MSGLFPTRSSGDAWFRVGRLDVGSVTFVVLLTVVSWVAWAIAPGVGRAMAFSPDAMAAGQVWGLFTWPWAGGISLFGVINLFFFWWFGNDLEAETGRGPMAWLLVGIWGSLTVAYTIASLSTGDSLGLAGIGLVQFLLMLVWIADNPRRPFFFNIPAWVIGVVLVAVQVLGLLAGRAWAGLLALLLSFVFVAVMARRAGLLADMSWLPGRRRQRRPRPVRQPDAPTPRDMRRRTDDAGRLDELLDKIGSEGIHSLTAAERKELDKLRERRRNGR